MTSKEELPWSLGFFGNLLLALTNFILNSCNSFTVVLDNLWTMEYQYLIQQLFLYHPLDSDEQFVRNSLEVSFCSS